MQRDQPFCLRWRAAVLSPDHDLSTYTRAVLLALQHHMTDDGECWPSVRGLAASLNAERHAVSRHLKLAAEAGWLRIEVAGHTGRGWRRHRYQATWPHNVGTESTHPAHDVGTGSTIRGYSQYHDVGTGSALNSPRELSMNSSRARPRDDARAREGKNGIPARRWSDCRSAGIDPPRPGESDEDVLKRWRTAQIQRNGRV